MNLAKTITVNGTRIKPIVYDIQQKAKNGQWYNRIPAATIENQTRLWRLYKLTKTGIENPELDGWRLKLVK